MVKKTDSQEFAVLPSENIQNLSKILYVFPQVEIDVACDYVNAIRNATQPNDSRIKLENAITALQPMADQPSIAESLKALRDQLDKINGEAVNATVIPSWLVKDDTGKWIVKSDDPKPQPVSFEPITFKTVLERADLRADTGSTVVGSRINRAVITAYGKDDNCVFVLSLYTTTKDDLGNASAKRIGAYRINENGSLVEFDHNKLINRNERKTVLNTGSGLITEKIDDIDRVRIVAVDVESLPQPILDRFSLNAQPQVAQPQVATMPPQAK
jgi:hypothetical protein